MATLCGSETAEGIPWWLKESMTDLNLVFAFDHVFSANVWIYKKSNIPS